MVSEFAEPARRRGGPPQLVAQRGHRVAKPLDRVHKPALPLQRMPEAPGTPQPLPHGTHARDESFDRRAYVFALQVPENVMAVGDGRNIVQGKVKVPIEMFVGIVPDDIVDNLVQIQVRQTLWCREILETRASSRVREQDASECCHLVAHLPLPCMIHW